MNIDSRPRYAILIFLSLLLGCRGSQPEKPVEISLKLAKSHIKAGEYLWYMLEMKNVGHKPLTVDDPLWFKQGYAGLDWSVTGPQTRLDIIGPDSKPAHRLNMPYGFHGEHHFWANDCGGGKTCDDPRLWKKTLRGGETFAATPSMVAPIRAKRPWALDDAGDMRDIPQVPKGLTPDQVQTLRKKWKDTVEGSGYLMGDPTFRSTETKSAVDRPNGYRVLDVYNFDTPGNYRMRFTYGPFDFGTEDSLREHVAKLAIIPDTFIKNLVEEWGWPKWLLSLSGDPLNRYLMSKGWPKETRVFLFESNWVTFEVETSPFPEHLFPHRTGKTPEQQKKTEWLRRKMKESFTWDDKSAAPAKGRR